MRVCSSGVLSLSFTQVPLTPPESSNASSPSPRELEGRHEIGVDRILWGSDYPHHEGSWPHSAASIERQMGELREDSRAKILGGNARQLYRL